jgi:flavin-dependent dehydrogenase
MASRIHFGIIIAGAGPAGISTALHLAKSAPELISRCLILEQGCHPRPKLCAGGILPDGEAILEHLGLDINEIPHVDVDWAHLDFNCRGMRLRLEKSASQAFRTIRRDEFDAWLADKARQRGFQIRENTRVETMSVDNSGVTLETNQGSFQADVVVGADGSTSLVRQMILPREKFHMARLLEAVTDPRPEASCHIQADSYFDFFPLPKGILGYTWDFPVIVNGKFMRARGVYDSCLHHTKTEINLRQALAEEFQRHGLDLENYTLQGFPLRQFDAKSAFCVPRVLLVGDAAGADGLYGEGISHALAYGELAARSVQDAFERDDLSFSGYRKAILHSAMGRTLRRRAWFARILYRLRHPVIQAFIWQHMSWFIKWAVQNFVVGWVKRPKDRKK